MCGILQREIDKLSLSRSLLLSLIISLFGDLFIHSFVPVEEIPLEIEEESGWIFLFMETR